MPEMAVRRHLGLDRTALLRQSKITNKTGQQELGTQRKYACIGGQAVSA